MTDFQTPPSLLLFLTSISVWCHLEKRSLHCCVSQDSQETMLEEEERGNSAPSLFHCHHLQTLNASSNRVAKGGVKRTEPVPTGKASLFFTGTRIWPMPGSIPSLGLRTSLAPRSRLPLLRGTALAGNSALTSIHHSYSSACWILAWVMEAPVSASYERKAPHNSLLASPSTPLSLSLPFPSHPSLLMVFSSEV